MSVRHYKVTHKLMSEFLAVQSCFIFSILGPITVGTPPPLGNNMLADIIIGVAGTRIVQLTCVPVIRCSVIRCSCYTEVAFIRGSTVLHRWTCTLCTRRSRSMPSQLCMTSTRSKSSAAWLSVRTDKKEHEYGSSEAPCLWVIQMWQESTENYLDTETCTLFII